MKLHLAAALLGGLLMANPTVGAAQSASTYPDRPIKIIVPFAPGSTSDFLARLLQPRLTETLKQQVVVENRSGAAGNIGVEVAARSAPDGYTLLLGNVGTMTINPSLFQGLPIDPQRDLAPISLAAGNVSILIASPKFPPNTVQEFIGYAKARPGKVNFASPGSGSLNRLKMELFRQKYGLDMNHVPYKGGGAPAVADLIGGHVEVMFVTISSAVSQVKAGRLKALAVTSKERLPLLPDVPTLVELGIDTEATASWQGLLAPAGTPQPIIDRLHAAVVAAMADPAARQRLEQNGDVAITSQSPAEFKAYMAAESERWSKVITQTGAKPD